VEFAVRVERDLENFRLLLFQAVPVGPSLSPRREERAFRWVADHFPGVVLSLEIGVIAPHENLTETFQAKITGIDSFTFKAYNASGSIALTRDFISPPGDK
jgi:hypothetical protein